MQNSDCKRQVIGLGSSLVEVHLPRMCQALGLIPSMRKKKKANNKTYIKRELLKYQQHKSHICNMVLYVLLY